MNSLTQAGSIMPTIFDVSNKIYIDKYLEVATGGRVKFESTFGFTSRLLRFKCQKCGDNWNVGVELFIANNQFLMPVELTDWVVQHQHVCSAYSPLAGIGSPCLHCEWPFHKHKHKQAQPVYNEDMKEWIVPSPGSRIAYAEPVQLGGVGRIVLEPLPEYKGRKFR